MTERKEKSRIKYLFDCTFIYPEIQYKGIPTYAFRLLHAIPVESQEDCHVLINPSMEISFKKEFPNLSYTIVKIAKLYRIFDKIGLFVNDRIYRRAISRLDFDSVLIIDEFRPCTLFKCKARKISVIHDLKGLKLFDNNQRYLYFEKLISSSDAIVAISNYTKKDIHLNFKVAESKVCVVYNSVSVATQSQCPNNFSLRKNYILYVNTLQEYKNPLTLLKAFSKLDREDLFLVFVGTSTVYWEKEVMSFASKCGISKRIIRLENVSNEELKYLYENAKLFVTTSIHEGFGYTPIEAAISKCPVISSTCEALPDTTQGLLSYYEPATDIDELKNRIEEMLNQPPSFEKLSEISNILSTLYSPSNQAKRILEIMDGNIKSSKSN